MEFLFTLDLEEFDRLDKGMEISAQGLNALVPVLENHGVVGTFFTTAGFAEEQPDAVKALAESGHEIALHALDHTDDYGAMPAEKATERLGDAKTQLEEIAGTDIIGFRAPRMSPPSPDVLRSIGIRYDSSLHPTWVPGRYNKMREPRKPFELGKGLIELPVSVTRLRFPISWFWFRNLGPTYVRICSKGIIRQMGYIHIYFHPWDFVDLREHDLPFLVRRNSHRSLAWLDSYLERVKAWNGEPMTVRSFLEKRGLI